MAGLLIVCNYYAISSDHMQYSVLCYAELNHLLSSNGWIVN